MFHFSCRFAFLSTFRLSNRTPKIAQILTPYQANAATLMPLSKEDLFTKFCVTSCYKKRRAQQLTEAHSMHALYSVCSLITSKPTWKLKHANSVLEPSRAFWIFLPNIIKIYQYHFELYRFKVGPFFRHSIYTVSPKKHVTTFSTITFTIGVRLQ